MRCEICNRGMTEPFYDGEGIEHNYCMYCIEEIYDTLDSYDEEDDLWYLDDEYLDDLMEDYEDEESSFLDQEVNDQEEE